MCETIEKITLLSVYPNFFVFYESKKYLKGTLLSLQMQYFNKQGQQTRSKILKHPDEVTRFDGFKKDLANKVSLLCFGTVLSSWTFRSRQKLTVFTRVNFMDVG
jgi:hypothetical protein